MALKFLKKENAKLKFLYRQKRHLTSDFSRLLLIQPYFSYGSSSWFHLLKKNLKIKHEKAQNKKKKKKRKKKLLLRKFTSDIPCQPII